MGLLFLIMLLKIRSLRSHSAKNRVNFGEIMIVPEDSLLKLVKKVASTDKTVLIQGETGTGKDVLAQQIHRQSKCKNGPFAPPGCGLLSQNLAEANFMDTGKVLFPGRRPQVPPRAGDRIRYSQVLTPCAMPYA